MSAPSNSLQQPRVRRSTAGSPGSVCRLHPLRATVPYQLLSPGGQSSSPTQRTQTLSVGGGTPTSTCISNPASPILNSGANGKQRHSPENKDSGSPDSAICRVERSKFPVRGSSAILRTASLDAITGPYLTGQWPRDAQGPSFSCMKDKATQTPGPWIDDALDHGSPHQRSASWGSADHLKEIAKLRLQLQRSKQLGRQGKDKEHASLPQYSPAPLTQYSPVSLTQYSPACPAQPKAMSSSLSVPTKPLISRVPSYVEGVSHELENVFIREDWEQSLQAMDVMDGRRAPFPPHRYGNGGDTRDTDTQAPSSSSDGSPSPRPGSPSPRPGSPSPRTGSPCSVDDADKDLPKFATSPKPNNSYMFKREPPEGCERVKVFEESLSSRSRGFPLFSCPDKNKVNFIPRGSAFCPVKLLCSSLCSSAVAPSSYADLGFHGNAPTTPTIRIKDTDAAGAGATDGSTDTTETSGTDPGSEGSTKALLSSS